MFGIGGFELFIILIFGFLIFGPEKLPDIARTVGRGIAKFREAQQEMNETLGNDKIFDPNNPDEPFKDPIEALDKLAQRQEEKRKAKEGSAKAAAGMAAGAASSVAAGKAAGSGAGTAGTAGAAGATGASAADASATTESSKSTNGDGAADASSSEQPARQESFTERKARYERERAARKAAEKKAAEEAASGKASEEPAYSAASAEKEESAASATSVTTTMSASAEVAASLPDEAGATPAARAESASDESAAQGGER